jgi:hypothetical protein
MRRSTAQDKVIIADTQTKDGSPTIHLEALGRFIWDKKPGYVIHIGDHWDLPSLSTYASKIAQEGQRLYDDLQSGNDAFDLIMKESKMRNFIGKKKQYSPNKKFLKGNHEFRLERYINEHPVLAGCFDIGAWITNQGWEVHEFNVPLFINDVCYVHYLENAMSGRPVGGSMESKLNKFPHSFVHGHQQQHQYASRQNLLGKPHFGACAGSFYLHDEGYRGANNTEKRGFLYMKAFENRYGYLDYDIEFVSLERLLKEYG